VSKIGVDYSAHLAYGVEIADIRDEDKFPDGIWEYESYYADAIAKDLGVEINDWEDRGKILREIPCPVNIMAFGAPNYDGKGTYIIGPREFCHRADQYDGSVTPIEIGNPDPDKAIELINGFLKLIGLPESDEEPRWVFGMYVS
jgi:hypothetical protein